MRRAWHPPRRALRRVGLGASGAGLECRAGSGLGAGGPGPSRRHGAPGREKSASIGADADPLRTPDPPDPRRTRRPSWSQVGGGLRTYTGRGRRRLDGYPETTRCARGAGARSLMPWPNRLGDGRFEWRRPRPADGADRAGAPQRHPRAGAMGTVDGRGRGVQRPVRLEYRLYPAARLALDPRPALSPTRSPMTGSRFARARSICRAARALVPSASAGTRTSHAFGGPGGRRSCSPSGPRPYVADERGLPVRTVAGGRQRAGLPRPAAAIGAVQPRHGLHRPGPGRRSAGPSSSWPAGRRVGPRYPPVDGRAPTPT